MQPPTPPGSPTAVPDSEAKPVRGRWWRWLAWTLGALFLFVVLVLGAIVGGLQTEWGRAAAARALNHLIAGASGPALHIDGLAPGFPLRLAFDALTLADADGVWLTIDNFDFRWRPAALFTGTLTIDTIAARRIAVARLPVSAEPSPPKPKPATLQIPKLPLNVQIDRLAVETLALAAPVVGEPVALTVNGKLGATAGAAITSDLAVHRTDGGSLALDAAARLEPATSLLGLDVKLNEGAHGLLAKLAGLEGGPPISLTLAGAGPLDAWDGQLAFTATDVATIAAAIRLRQADARRIEIDGRGDWRGDWPHQPPALIPPIIRPAVADGITFAAAVDRGTGGPITLDHLSLQGRGLEVAAKGTVDPSEQQLNLTLDANLAAAALAANAMGGFTLRSARAQVAASGALASPELRAQGTVEGITGPDLAVSKLEWTAAMLPIADAANDRAVSLAATATAVQPADAKLRAALGPTIDLDAEGRLNATPSSLALHSLSLRTAAARVDGKGLLALDDADSNLDLVVSADDLGKLDALTGMALAGRGQIKANVSGPLLHGKAVTAIEAGVTNFASKDAVIQALLGSTPSAAAQVIYDAASGVNVPHLRLDGRNLQANGTALLDDKMTRLRAELNAEIRDLAPVAAAAGTAARGRLRLTANASGKVADPDATAVVTLSDGRVDTMTIRDARLEATAKTLVSRPTGTLRADAATSEGPVQLSAAFAKPSAESMQMNDIKANVLGMRIEGELALDPASGLINGRLVGGLPAAGFPQAKPRLRGAATFNVGLKPQGRAQGVDVRLRSGALAVVDGNTTTATLDSLGLEATVADALATPRVQAHAAVKGLRFGAEGPFDTTADVAGPLADLVCRLDLRGPKNGVRVAHATARVNAANQPLRVSVDAFTAEVAAYRLALRQPMTITSGSGRLAISNLNAEVGDGDLRGTVDIRPGATAIALDAHRLPLGIARPWVNGIPDGLVALQTHLQSNRGATTGPFEVLIDRLKVTDPIRKQSTVTGHAAIRGLLGNDGLTASGDASIGDGVAADFSAHLPVTLPAGQLTARIPENGALDAQAKVNADLALVAQTLAFSDQRLAGRLNADVNARGTLQHPALTGSAVLSNGLYENFVSGTLLTGIDGSIEMAHERQATVALTARTKGNGSLAVNGQAMLGGEDGGNIDLMVTAKQALLVKRDDVTAITNATIRYQGSPTKGSVSGEIKPVSIEIRLLDRLPPSVVVIPVIEINRPAGDTGGGDTGNEGKEAASGPGFLADLDMDIVMPSRVFVRGRGLDSEWSGHLHVGGTTAVPRLTGTIEAVRGVFTFASKRFDVQKGTITFTGGQPIDPMLNIAATYRTPEITAVIGVTGTASDPKLGVTSQPPLPQSEVLAQVLFGKSSARLGPVEAMQLASAVDTLARGESWSEDMLGSVRQFLGLDVLSVGSSPSTTGDASGATVEAGRYVSQGVYVGAKQDLSDNSTGGKVEVELTPGISVQSDLTQNAEGVSGSIGLRWKHDY